MKVNREVCGGFSSVCCLGIGAAKGRALFNAPFFRFTKLQKKSRSVKPGVYCQFLKKVNTVQRLADSEGAGEEPVGGAVALKSKSKRNFHLHSPIYFEAAGLKRLSVGMGLHKASAPPHR